jgi:DNA uptake protein ComE-like DNA-binding protein
MGPKHWLDPLARRVLLATGQLSPAAAALDPGAPDPGSNVAPSTVAPTTTESDAVERDLLDLRLRQQPDHRLRNATEVRLAAELGWRLDVNRATAADWLRLPGISADQVDLLIRLQAGGVQLSGPEDLQRLLDLPAAVITGWQPLLAYRWYGEPPAGSPPARVDINKAHVRELEALGLSSQRCSRLLRERARAAFEDLADLQQRLHLPAELIESWIGRVSFGKGQAGPKLPLPRRPG